MHILHRVFCNVMAYVSCRGYVSIPQSARHRRESGWHHGVYSSLTEAISVGDFCFIRGVFYVLVDKTMVQLSLQLLI